MLQAGLSLQAFRQWAGTPNDLVLFPNYCIKGTLGHALLQGARQVVVAAPMHAHIQSKRLWERAQCYICALKRAWAGGLRSPL